MASNNSAVSPKPEQQAQTKGANPMSEETLSAVAHIFLPSRAFEERLGRLRAVFDQADIFGDDAIEAFESMVKLVHLLERLAEPYGSVKAFQNGMAQLARDFEPISGLQKIFGDISENFRDQLKAVASTLEPAKKLQRRLAELAKLFEPASELQAEFLQLAEVFGPPPSGPVDADDKILDIC